MLIRIALNHLSIPELLVEEEILQNQFILSSALKSCAKIGNYLMATDLITKLPSQSFLYHFDPHVIDLVRQIITFQRQDGTGLSIEMQIELAMLLASFHFPQPEILETFKRLIRVRINNRLLQELSRKRTMAYYDSVKSRSFCTIS